MINNVDQRNNNKICILYYIIIIFLNHLWNLGAGALGLEVRIDCRAHFFSVCGGRKGWVRTAGEEAASCCCWLLFELLGVTSVQASCEETGSRSVSETSGPWKAFVSVGCKTDGVGSSLSELSCALEELKNSVKANNHYTTSFASLYNYCYYLQ